MTKGYILQIIFLIVLISLLGAALSQLTNASKAYQKQVNEKEISERYIKTMKERKAYGIF